ncbi:MAG: TniB family NTP-binding protein [Rickettsiaceae bacterium]|nr:TniB family NTP-binding protein [Rickettsiaceae bacterium]
MDHLLPNICNVALLSVEQRIAKLRSECWIGYTKAEEALDKMEELLNYPKRIRMPNMLLISPTNNGKTMIIEKFRRGHLSNIANAV